MHFLYNFFIMSQTPSLLPEDFVDMVSHEMRTPLTSIRASLGLLSAGVHGDQAPDQQRVLSIAISNLERMGRLLDDLLDMAKIRGGKLELRRDRVCWAEMIREVVQTFEPLARERGISLTARPISGTIESYADRDKIVQVLNNLVHNALKFTPQGQIVIAVADSPDAIECSVSDTGPGIPPEQLPRLFSKFTQLGSKSQTGERGSGLGLSLARQLVELQGGQIRAENGAHGGARFIFTFPHLDAHKLFEKEAKRLVGMATRHEKPLSLARFEFLNWPLIESTLGTQEAAALMDHFESLIRSSLRGESDFVLQSTGALWLAVFSVSKEDGLRILARIRQSFDEHPLPKKSLGPIKVSSRLVSYPQDGTAAEELFAHLESPAS